MSLDEILLRIERLSEVKRDIIQAAKSDDFDLDDIPKIAWAYLADIYNSSVGVWEEYTLNQHNSMMGSQFEYYDWGDKLPGNYPAWVMRLFLHFHDFGKIPAISNNGDRAFQHEYNCKIMEQAFDVVGVDGEYKKVAVAMSLYDPVGKYVAGKVSLDESVSMFQEMIDYSNMNAWDFYELFIIFYKTDASSYTEDSGGYRSLDHLFVFDRKNRKLKFSQDTDMKVNEIMTQLLL